MEFWRITLRQYVKLLKRFEMEQERQNFRAAMVTAAIYNTIRNPKKQAKPFTPEDFMAKKKKAKRQQSPEQMLATVKMLNSAFGGKDLSQDK